MIKNDDECTGGRGAAAGKVGVKEEEVDNDNEMNM